MTRPDTTLIQVVRDPLLPWKTSLEVFRKARARRMQVVVALDSRSAPGSYEAIKPLAHKLFTFDTQDEWPEGQLNTVLDAAEREWAFLVSDDEMPSDALWDFATKVPSLRDRGRHYLWRCRMLAPLPDWSAHYRPLDTYQPRYFPRESMRWPGGFDQLPGSALTEIDFQLVLWHYTLWSPRAERERKVLTHERAWYAAWDLHRWPFPGAISYLYEDHPGEYVPLGDFEEQRPCASSSPEPVALPRSA